jgi:hypothetical protein
MITESSLHREVLNIYYTASERTKPWYDLGRYLEGINEENWVIRWCLWHVFRYRDERNRHRGHGNSYLFFQEKDLPHPDYITFSRKSFSLVPFFEDEADPPASEENLAPTEFKGYNRRESIHSEQTTAVDWSCSDQSDQSDQGDVVFKRKRASIYYDPVRDVYLQPDL